MKIYQSMKLIPSSSKRSRGNTQFFILFTIAFSLSTVLSAQIQNTSDVYASTNRPRALVVMGDRYHSPVHVRDGLMRPLALENIPVVYLENHEALTAEALKNFELLIFLKDGNIWPNGYGNGSQVKWMTDAQQQAFMISSTTEADSWHYITPMVFIHLMAPTMRSLEETLEDTRPQRSLWFEWKIKTIQLQLAWKTLGCTTSST